MRLGNERKVGRKAAMLTGFLFVCVFIYFRPRVLGALGYADAGMPRAIFVVGSAIAIAVVLLIAGFVGRGRSDAIERRP
jgi:hypothetical protein